MKARDERLPNVELCELLLDEVLREFDDPRLLEIVASHFASPNVSIERFLDGIQRFYGDDVVNFFVGLSGGGEFPFSERLRTYREIARGGGYPLLNIGVNDKGEYTFVSLGGS